MIVLVVGLFMATIVFLVELPRKQKLKKATKVEDASEDNVLDDIPMAEKQASPLSMVALD